MFPHNIVDILRNRAKQAGTDTAITFLGNGETPRASLTYAELDRRARAVAAMLQHIGAEAKAVLVACPEGVDYVSALFGCLYARSVPVPAYPPLPGRLTRVLPRLNAIIADARAEVILTTGAIRARSEVVVRIAPQLRRVQWIAADELPTSEADFVECSLSTGGIAILQYTSGSTSLPKGVVISHANLMATLSYSAEVWVGTQENPVAVSWLPPFHDLGLIFGILQPIFSGFPLYLMSPLSFLQKPRRWLAAISRYKGTLSAAPNFAYDLCVSSISRDRGAGLDLSSWKMAGNAAEPIRARTIERFSKAFEAFGFRREAFSCGYGLAEATLAVCGSDWKRAPTVIDVDTQALESGHVVLASAAARTVRSFVGCGKPQSTAISEIAIVDPATKIRCQPDRAGELWVRGAGIAQGYWMKPDDTREIFEARLADTNDGPFLRTGDLGFILDGEVFITGRLKEVLIVRGRCLYPHDLEMTVQETHQALRIGCGAAFSVEVEEQERVVIVQEIDSRRVSLNLTELHRCAQRALFERHGVTAEVIFVKRGTVPKTSSGKIRRADCRASYLQQRLDFVGLPPTAGMTMRRTLQDCSGHHG